MTQLKDKRVLVLGLGETGLSMLRWLSAQGARLRIADSRSSPPGVAEAGKYVAAGQIYCGAFGDAMFEGIDLIAISPGVPLRDTVVAKAVARGIPVVGDIELFAQQLAASGLRQETKVLAITGANGKTTVTSMVEHLCKAAGKDAVAAGNISPAVLDVVLARGANQPGIWVLELSSFQLETTATLEADAATVLNVSEDHLDRYADMDEYAAAKARIFAGAAALHSLPHLTLARGVSGVQVLNRDDVRSMGMAVAGREIVTFGLDAPRSERDFGVERDGGDIWLTCGRERLLKADELQIVGLHNVANALAALALCRSIGLPMPALLAGLRSFRGLPHRVERVAEIDGVLYYDDSKGTNVGATVAALEGLGGMARCAQTPGVNVKVVLIAGGEGKGQDFAPLRPAVMQHARSVVLIGRDARLIASALEGCGVPVLFAKTMREAVRQGAQLAQSGDAVLLSPACASFDMFHNYAHRAEMFVEAVHELIKEAAWSR